MGDWIRMRVFRGDSQASLLEREIQGAKWIADNVTMPGSEVADFYNAG